MVSKMNQQVKINWRFSLIVFGCFLMVLVQNESLYGLSEMSDLDPGLYSKVGMEEEIKIERTPLSQIPHDKLYEAAKLSARENKPVELPISTAVNIGPQPSLVEPKVVPDVVPVVPSRPILAPIPSTPTIFEKRGPVNRAHQKKLKVLLKNRKNKKPPNSSDKNDDDDDDYDDDDYYDYDYDYDQSLLDESIYAPRPIEQTMIRPPSNNNNLINLISPAGVLPKTDKNETLLARYRVIIPIYIPKVLVPKNKKPVKVSPKSDSYAENYQLHASETKGTEPVESMTTQVKTVYKAEPVPQEVITEYIETSPGDPLNKRHTGRVIDRKITTFQ